ncbi:MAG TPA: aspartate kinase [Polyangiaceae bacterium]|jgi:aspartate kinase|nr:aspartate kinase [Polyangiaceae bacterium]
MSDLTVEKIGGTSMSRFSEVLSNVILRNPKHIYGRIYIVSAYAGVTDLLLEAKKSKQPGVYTHFASGGPFAEALQAVKRRFFEINAGMKSDGLDVAAADQFIGERVESVLGYLNSIADLLASGYVTPGELLSAARELLASIGESHSAFNSANILERKGYTAQCIDLSGWADPKARTIDERIALMFADVGKTPAITFVTGYCKGTEGIMREFDRGYSEVTFSKVAVAVKAKEAVIHKEFHLSSADPKIIGPGKVVPVCNTNFDVADQLADVGMEAIHPRAAKPLELSGIPLRVKNAFDPDHDGTLITKDYTCPVSKIEVVTGTDKVSIVEVFDTRMVAEVGSDHRIMQVLVDHGISYISKATNANTIDLVLWDRDLQEPIISKLRGMFDVVKVIPVAIVCAIGSNIAKPGILARATGSLARARINIIGVSQTARQTNMQFTVGREDFVLAQQALHAELCESSE